MYLHLGGEVVLPIREVVALLDARTARGSVVLREFLERAAAKGRLHGEPDSPECRTLVITAAGRVYTSAATAATLARRMTHLRQSAKAWNAEN
ncbi:MAG TPA: DUF370 domain-containing protein [bacterium]|nr:DUF370 domain-containing protein [bacterium]